MKIPTSIAFSNPCIGAIKTCDKVAPTVPLPLTISSPANCAFGSTCDNIPRPKIRIRIIEKDDNITLAFFLAISFYLLFIIVPVFPLIAAFAFSRELIIAFLSSESSTKDIEASTLGSILPLAN